MTVELCNDSRETASRLALEALFPLGDIFACDFYVTDIEKGREVVGGYQCGRVINIDHHAPTRKMERRVSSANLAIERLRAVGRPAQGSHTVINHTDCDSVLTAAMIAGDLEPDIRFGRAAIAADHNGAEDEISDLLQGFRERRDYQLALRNLKLLLAGEPLEAVAQAALDERRRRRGAARLIVEQKFDMVGSVAFVDLDENADGELFLDLLPEAVVIVLAVPSKKGSNPRDMKLWLGNAAPEGFTLRALHIEEFDPNYGGRWNAGSNRRDGGTSMSAREYAEEVARRVRAALDQGTAPR